MSTTNTSIRGVDPEKKRKCIFVLKAKGTTLSDVVRDVIDRYAEEFDEKFGKEDK